MKDFLTSLRDGWRIDTFARPTLDAYAAERLREETRTGVAAMSLVMLALVITGLLLSIELGFDRRYLYGYAAVAALSLHVHLATRRVSDLHGLHLLGIALLVVSATAFVFIAHGTRGFTTLLFSNVLLLFMAVPMVPWGTREALAATGLLYLLLSASVGGVAERFSAETLMTLQFLMIGAASISLLLVARSVRVRRDDLRARFELESAREDLFELSNRDALTGAWNRRYAGQALAALQARHAGSDVLFEVAVIDLDDFKQLNDACGHDVGDFVLTLVTRCLEEAIGAAGFVFRFGGDEFVVYHVGSGLTGCLEQARAGIAAHAAVRRESAGRGITLSYGIARAPLTPDLDAGALYRAADARLYAAKSARATG